MYSMMMMYYLDMSKKVWMYLIVIIKRKKVKKHTVKTKTVVGHRCLSRVVNIINNY